jgi:hypothetical protein
MKNSEKVFRAHRAIAWFYAVIGLTFTGFALFGGEHRLTGEFIAPMVVFGAIFSAHYFTARACRAEKPGGRIASIVIACLLLLAFPVGTLIGVYLLSNTWRPWRAAS